MNLWLKNLLLLVLMLSASGLALALRPTQKIADQRAPIDLRAMIPSTFGDWAFDDSVAPVSTLPEQAAALTAIYDQMVSRTYKNSQGERVMLSVAYGSAQTKQLRTHRQEVCYAAQGFKIENLHSMSLKLGGQGVDATRMLAIHGDRSEPVTYWFTMGDIVVRSYLDRELAQLKYAVTGYIPDGYLVRVSSLSTDEENAYQKQLSFLEAMLSSVDPVLRAGLLGETSQLHRK